MWTTGDPAVDKLIVESLIKQSIETVKGLLKKKVLKLSDDQTQKDLEDVIRSMLMGKMPPENFEEMIQHAQDRLTPYHSTVQAARRMQVGIRGSVAKKKPATKKVAKKKPATKKVAKKRSAY